MQEDYARSADEARQGLHDAPDDPDLLRVLSAAEEQQGHLAEAEEAILAALRESPDSAGLLCQYAELLMRGGQLEKAGHLIDAAAAIDPDAGDVLEARLRLSYLRADDRRRPQARRGAARARSRLGGRPADARRARLQPRLRRSRRRPARRRRGRVPEPTTTLAESARQAKALPQSRLVADPLLHPLRRVADVDRAPGCC